MKRAKEIARGRARNCRSRPIAYPPARRLITRFPVNFVPRPRHSFYLGNNRFNQGRLPSRAICTKFRSFEPARYMWVAQLRRMPAKIRICASVCVRARARGSRSLARPFASPCIRELLRSLSRAWPLVPLFPAAAAPTDHPRPAPVSLAAACHPFRPPPSTRASLSVSLPRATVAYFFLVCAHEGR